MRNNIYDQKTGYKFTEELRNYSLHRALPIGTIYFNDTIEDVESHESSDMITSISIFADKEKLIEDEKFKHKILVNMPDKIDIIHCLRSHMAGLWELHNHLLAETKSLGVECRQIIENAIHKFGASPEEGIVGLMAYASEQEKTHDQVVLLLKWDDVRLRLIKRLGHLKNLDKRYISGKIKKRNIA